MGKENQTNSTEGIKKPHLSTHFGSLNFRSEPKMMVQRNFRLKVISYNLKSNVLMDLVKDF